MPGGVGWEKGQLNDIVSMILTSAKNNHIAPDNRTLTVAKTKKKVRRAPRSEQKRSDTNEENKKPGGKAFLQSDVNELAYASEDHDPANRQVDEPTMQQSIPAISV